MNEKFLQKLSFVTKKSLLTSVVGSVALLGGSAFGESFVSPPDAVPASVNVTESGTVAGAVVNDGATLTLGSGAAGVATLTIAEGSSYSSSNAAAITLANNANLTMVLNNKGTLTGTGTDVINLNPLNVDTASFILNNDGTIEGNSTQGATGNNPIVVINMGDGISSPRFVGNITDPNTNAGQLNIRSDFSTEGTVDGELALSVTSGKTFTVNNNVTVGTVAAPGTVNVASNTLNATGLYTGDNGAVNVLNGGTLDLDAGGTFAAGTLTVKSGGAVNVAGANLTIAAAGGLVLEGGGLTFEDARNIVATAANSSVYLKEDTLITGDGAGGGALVLNNANSVLKLNLGASSPVVTNANAVAASDFNNGTISVKADGYLPNGMTHVFFDSATNPVTNAAANHNVSSDSLDSDFTLAGALVDNGNGPNTAYRLTVTRTRLLHEKAGVPEQKDVSEGIEKSALTNADLRAVLGTTLSSSSIKDGLGQYASDKMGGAHTGVVMSADRVTNASFMHLAELRDDTAYAAGGHSSGLGGWAKVFGTSAEQKERKGVEGHDVGSVGLSVGFDKMLSNKFVMGAGVGYASTEVKSRLSAASKVDVDTWQVVGYGSYTGGKFFMDGALSYSGNKFDRTRIVKGGTSTYNYVADHNGHNFGAKFLVGFNMGTSMMVTPTLGLSYVKSKQDGYTEKADSRAASALVVGESTVDMLKGKVGLEFSKAFKSKGGGMSRPSLELAVAHDFTGDENSATYHFNSPNAPTFVVKGPKPAETSFLLGLGWRHEGGHKEFGVRYDLEVKDQFMSHAGMATFRYNW